MKVYRLEDEGSARVIERAKFQVHNRKISNKAEKISFLNFLIKKLFLVLQNLSRILDNLQKNNIFDKFPCMSMIFYYSFSIEKVKKIKNFFLTLETKFSFFRLGQSACIFANLCLKKHLSPDISYNHFFAICSPNWCRRVAECLVSMSVWTNG